MLGIVAATCIGVGLLRPVIIENRALDAIITGGGAVSVVNSRGEPASILARRFSQSELSITFRNGVSSPASVGMRMLKKVDRVYVDGTQVLDWSFLASLNNVRHLRIRNGSNNAFAHMRRLNSLKILEFARGTSVINDNGLESLNSLPNLTCLSFVYVDVTDDCLVRIGRLKALRELVVIGADITDDGVANLRSLHNLEILYLQETRISPDCLKHIACLSSLKELHLSSVAFVCDNTSAFEELRDMQLSLVDVNFLILDQSGMPEISHLFSNCDITYDVSRSRRKVDPTVWQKADLSLEDPF
jgi:hypothetical protein